MKIEYEMIREGQKARLRLTVTCTSCWVKWQKYRSLCWCWCWSNTVQANNVMCDVMWRVVWPWMGRQSSRQWAFFFVVCTNDCIKIFGHAAPSFSALPCPALSCSSLPSPNRYCLPLLSVVLSWLSGPELRSRMWWKRSPCSSYCSIKRNGENRRD